MPETATILEYKGPISIRVIERLLNKLRSSRDFQNMAKPARKRLYGTFVESIDNIKKYAALAVEDSLAAAKPSEISVMRRGGACIVTSGNLVPNDDIGELRFKLDRVNQLDYEALKSLYEEIINRESAAGDRGAGLGLITMALKTEEDIKYSFTAVDANYSFFKMQITLKD